MDKHRSGLATDAIGENLSVRDPNWDESDKYSAGWVIILNLGHYMSFFDQIY